MKNHTDLYRIIIIPFLLLFLNLSVQAKGDFDIVKNKKVATIIYDASDYKTIEIVANLLADDIEMISGVRPNLSTNMQEKVRGNAILIGSIDKSDFIKELKKQNKINISNVINGWEQYSWQFVKNLKNIDGSLMVISGSDKRGTAFGVFELSEKIGVSP